MLFEGSGVAIITPFNEDGSVDTKAYENLVNFQIDNGTDAIIVLGTTGEATTLTLEERIELVKESKRIIDGRVPMIVGTGTNNTQATIEYSQQIAEIGVDGLLVVTPYYNKATAEGLYQHFATIADSVDTDIILYNVPSRTNVTIPPATVARLAEIDNIVGIKDATADLNYTATVRGLVPEDFGLYSGNDDVAVPLLSVGGNGLISVGANAIPKQFADMIHAGIEGDFEKAGRLQVELTPLIKSLAFEVNPVPVKAAVELIGLSTSQVRLPLTKATDETVALLKETFADYIQN